MPIVKTNSKHYTNIANAIRDKTNSSDTYTPEEMADGVLDVFDAGKKAEYDRFWDEYQQNGNRMNYGRAFAGVAWTADTLRPKYDIVPLYGGAALMFQGSGFVGSLKEHFNSLGIALDTSQAQQGVPNMYYTAFHITEVPDLDVRNGTSMNSTFYDCNELQKVKIKVSETTTNLANCFYNCNELTDLIIEGTLAVDIDVKWSTKLTHDSLMSIITALKDFSEDTSGTTHTATLGTGNLAKLTTDEKKIIQNKGWQYN